ncbi:hypothetical protein [Planktothrix serta]|nr:hypothetical protein [Planktothrix serta]
MNALWPRVLKSAYRREPIVSFVVTVGTVDAVIGGVSSSLSLLSFGLSTVGVILVLRWWMLQRSKIQQPETAPEYSLPPSSSRPPLPKLTTDKHRSPYSGN